MVGGGGVFSKSGKNKQFVKMKTKTQKLNILNKDETIQRLLLSSLKLSEEKNNAFNWKVC